MKTVDVLGSMSDHATSEYYQLLNEMVSARLRGWNTLVRHESPPVLKARYLGTVDKPQIRGAEEVVLRCTEFILLISQASRCSTRLQCVSGGLP